VGTHASPIHKKRWIVGEGDTSGEAWSEILSASGNGSTSLMRRMDSTSCSYSGGNAQHYIECQKLAQKENEEIAATMVNSCLKN
jgi:hypothetical protein